MINGRTRLHVVANGTMTGQRYIDEVLLPHVRLFRGTVGDKFVFMDDNATCHRTLAVQDCLDSEGIQRFVWPACSQDLNPTENVWDALGKQVAGRNYPPTHKNTLIRTLTEEWDKLPQQLLDNFVQKLTKNIHSTIVEDRKTREENLRIEEQKEKLRIEEREEKLRFEQLRLDEQKRKDEFELEKLRIQTQSKIVTDGEVSHIIAREPDDKANSYEHVKDLLLKRFKLTPEKFRQLFVTHRKAPERTWIDFYHELNTYFNGWIDGLKIDTFNKLSDLIITDQLKRKTPFEFKEYYLDEWANMNSPVQLAEKLEEFEDFKRTLKQKCSSPFVKKQEFRFTEKNRRYEAPGKVEYNRKDKKFPASTNYNKHYEAPVTKNESVQRYQDSAQRGYYNKNYEKHSNHNASKHICSDELFKIAEIQRTSKRNLHTHR
ncbi:uncharacterized protein TNCV_2702841 [Trichonephila clavipes]|nr:uncharacterized protein TNCV_2702841 [Trichonephila clavipes]